MDYSPNFIAKGYRPNKHEVDSTEPFRAWPSMTQYPRNRALWPAPLATTLESG
jgi:hypothetical protein